MRWLKWLVNILKVVIIAGTVIYLVKYPGQIQFDWLGYRLRASVVFFFAILFITLGLIVFIKGTVKKIWSFPQYWMTFFKRRKQQKGEKALLESLSAIAGGELEEAEKQARVAVKNLPEQPLSVVIAAQAAFMCGKVDEALKLFQQLQQVPATKFLGLRGEALQALQRSDWPAAQRTLRQAILLRPDSPWALKHLFEADLHLGSYDRGEAVLKQLQTRKLIDPAKQRRYQALVYWLKAQTAQQTRDLSHLHHYLKKAYERAPELVYVATHYAEYEIENNSLKHAQKILAQAWFYQPHPELVRFFKKAAADKTSLDFYRYLAGLALQDASNYDANIILAETAIAAKLWGQARQHLQIAHTIQETQHSCQLMATLIRGETPHDGEAIRIWEQKALSASSGPLWLCRQCHRQQVQWDVFCSQCGSLDTVVWSLPQSVGMTKALLPQLI